MLGLKVSAILAACIYTVAGVRPPSRHKALSSGPLVCPSGEWYWAPKHVCLPRLVTAPGPDPHFPNGGICRPEWYWHQSGYCAPFSPDRLARFCPRGYKVNPSNFLCEPNVVPPPGPSQWYWGIKNIFLPTLTEQQLEKRPGPPLEKRGVCPMNWYWYENSYCAPRTGQYLRAECPSGYNWDINMFICRNHLEALPQASVIDNQCPIGEWYWSRKSICLPVGMPSDPLESPIGYICPPELYWHANGFCAPPTDQTKKGECYPGYFWKEIEHYCELMGHGGSSN